MKLEIYTDGSYWDNSGGWAGVFVASHEDKTMVKYIAGNHAKGTSQRMEIIAILRSLETLKRSTIAFTKVYLYSDSQYAINSINEWLDNWLRKGKVMKNMDLWNEYKQIRAGINQPIEFFWIKGHAGDKYNEMADKLAGEARIHKLSNERLTNL